MDSDDLRLERRRGFGLRVRRLREVQALSQEVLAERAQLHRTYVGSVERGERNPSLDSIYALADGLSLHVSQLFEDKADRAGEV